MWIQNYEKSQWKKSVMRVACKGQSEYSQGVQSFSTLLKATVFLLQFIPTVQGWLRWPQRPFCVGGACCVHLTSSKWKLWRLRERRAYPSSQSLEEWRPAFSCLRPRAVHFPSRQSWVSSQAGPYSSCVRRFHFISRTRRMNTCLGHWFKMHII